MSDKPTSTFLEVEISVPSAMWKRRPDPFMEDERLRQFLLVWKIGTEIPADVQSMCNFRLYDLLVEKGGQHRPMELAVEAVYRAMREYGWSQTYAIKEVARTRGVLVSSLTRADQKNRKTTPPARSA
jgi:hypothetical protein